VACCPFRKVTFRATPGGNYEIRIDGSFAGTLRRDGDAWAMRWEHVPGRVRYIYGPLSAAKAEARQDIAAIDAEIHNARRVAS
jgi:hypothetical protein